MGAHALEGGYSLLTPSVITSKAANGYHFKTGQGEALGTFMFYPVMPCPGKCISVLMRFCLYAFEWDFLLSEDKDSTVRCLEAHLQRTVDHKERSG